MDDKPDNVVPLRTPTVTKSQVPAAELLEALAGELDSIDARLTAATDLLNQLKDSLNAT